jgi:hypothetical protein
MTGAIQAITGTGNPSLFLNLLVAGSCNIKLTAYSNEEVLFTFIAVVVSHNSWYGHGPRTDFRAMSIL